MLSVSTLFDITIIVSCALLALYVYIKYTLKYWEHKNVPHKKPNVLFGNFKESLLLRESEGETSKKIYEEFQNERFVGAFYLRKRILIIRDPELIKMILTKDCYHFFNKRFDLDPQKEAMDFNLLLANGDLWRVLRKTLTPLFSSAKLKNMFKLMAVSGERFENYLERNIKTDQQTNITKLMPKFTMDVIGSCAFGLKSNTLDDSEDNIFIKMSLRIGNSSFKQYFKFLFKTYALRLFNFFNLEYYDREMTKFFVSLIKDTIEEREKSQTTRHDFVDLMKDLKHEGVIKGNSVDQIHEGEGQKQIEVKFDENLMAAQSFMFFNAGYETSYITMCYVLYELARNTDIQTKVCNEIDSVFQKYENQLIYESLKDFEFLEMVISETWRMYPITGNLERCCTSKYKIPGTDVTIDEGVEIFIPLLGLHTDPKYFPNPDKFDPYRFTKEAISKRHPYIYLPFGQGPRGCIALRFGKAQVMVGLISLLRNYNVHTCQDTPNQIRIKATSIVSHPTTDIYLSLKRRIIKSC